MQGTRCKDTDGSHGPSDREVTGTESQGSKDRPTGRRASATGAWAPEPRTLQTALPPEGQGAHATRHWAIHCDVGVGVYMRSITSTYTTQNCGRESTVSLWQSLAILLRWARARGALSEHP